LAGQSAGRNCRIEYTFARFQDNTPFCDQLASVFISLPFPRYQPVEGSGTTSAEIATNMEKLYVACDLGTRVGRIMLGTLQNGTLVMGEVRRFANTPIEEKGSLSWDVARMHQEILFGLRDLGQQEAAVQSISCTAWPSDYLLFSSDGSLLSPAFHFADPRGVDGAKRVQSKVAGGAAFIYAETGCPVVPASTLSQLAAESRRVKKAHCLLPIGDAFNYIFSGVPSVEICSASATQVLNPVARKWSENLIDRLDLRRELFPLLANSGTKLGPLRADIAKDTGLEAVQVLVSCSHQSAAALAGLPLEPGQDWAYLHLGEDTIVGAELPTPLINEVTRKLNYSNELCAGGTTNFYRRTPGLFILNECKRYWASQERDVSENVLPHLATTAPPFESLINPDEPCFSEPGDMPLKVQAYCRETGQEIPRKPGHIYRCVLESLALHYRKMVAELEVLTGRRFQRLYLLGAEENPLLNNFIANALQLPVTLASADAAATGNVLLQSIALGHIKSLPEGREIVRRSARAQTIVPHPNSWDSAAERLLNLIGHSGEAVSA